MLPFYENWLSTLLAWHMGTQSMKFKKVYTRYDLSQKISFCWVITWKLLLKIVKREIKHWWEVNENLARHPFSSPIGQTLPYHTWWEEKWMWKEVLKAPLATEKDFE